MELTFEQVLPNDHDKIFHIYEILKINGEYMYEVYGLTHWKTPYPISSIHQDSKGREVYLIRDIDENIYINTFQLEFVDNKFEHKSIRQSGNETAVINKFATLPENQGKGVGKKAIDFIEKYCKNKGCTEIYLEVYNQSIHAINFYEKNGFYVIGSKRTKHFVVSQMQKQI